MRTEPTIGVPLSLLSLLLAMVVLQSFSVSADPACPTHHGEVKDGDADGDGTSDTLLEKTTLYPSGVDVEVWCLDHGATGDFGLRISIPHDDYVWAGGCFFYCGNNSIAVELADGNVTVYWNNTATDGRDLHFKFSYPSNNLTITRTRNGTPVNSTVIPAPKNWSDLKGAISLLALQRQPTAGTGALSGLAAEGAEDAGRAQELAEQVKALSRQLSEANEKLRASESAAAAAGKRMITGFVIGLLIGAAVVFFLRKRS